MLKKKILMLCDHPLHPSGVGIQSKLLIDGLIATGKYSFRVLGGAIKHGDYNTIKVNEDFYVKPVDGFGNKQMIHQLLLTEQPDAILIFTDPRQFVWLWEMEDEIKQICPILYWHVWDNDPYPAFNTVWYDSTELINCLSYKTYSLLKRNYKSSEKVNYVPHAFPKTMFFPIVETTVNQYKRNHFQEKHDWFKVLWVARNATRKCPSDVMLAWKIFLDQLQQQHGHKNAVLVMHTDPTDMEGPNLFEVSELLGLKDNVWFSPARVGHEEMNILYNMCDVVVSLAREEGFGLPLLQALQVGKLVVALKTGGMTRQVVDHRTGVEYGVALEPVERNLIGSQAVPYIFSDIGSKQQTADGLLKIYNMPVSERQQLGQLAREYVDVEFNYDNMISTWDKTIESTLDNWTYNKPVQWELQEIGIVNHVLDVQRQLPPQQQAATSNPITSNVVQKLKINQPRGITK